jgi:phospholipase D1/2
VDGQDTYAAMADAIAAAREEIFIAGWFVSPWVYLKRVRAANGDLDVQYRLDSLLQKQAAAGVKVYILPWNETKFAVHLNSRHAKDVFEKLHKNINVLLHPLVFPVSFSHHQKIVVVDQNVAFVGGLDLAYGRFDDQLHDIVDPEALRWKGKDYYNPVVCGLRDVDKPWVKFELQFARLTRMQVDLFDRTKRPRMAWHDVHMKVEGLAARDVAANFIDRWNHHRHILEQLSYDNIVPKTTASYQKGASVCQTLRSVCDWSCGLPAGKKEASIYPAYIDEIAKAEHFIYIENQFFISSLAEPSIVHNAIADAILTRLRKAIEAREKFRVIVVLPVHPDGHYKENSSVRCIMHWQYQTIIKNRLSLLAQLKSFYPNENLDEYIGFFSLRTKAFFGYNRAVTEQIYVHSKLMIIDDRRVIVGSANINDRSMEGDRDSEICIHVTDDEKVQTLMNGKPFLANRFAHTLRLALWQEHLGLHAGHPDSAQIIDPVCDRSYSQIWFATAKENTNHYKALFPSVPHDQMPGMSTLGDVTLNVANADMQLMLIKGHLITFALDFLSD